MGEKRETRKDLPEREFDSDLNSPALSNQDDPKINQRDSGLHRGEDDKKKTSDDNEHDVGSADNLSR